MYNFPINFDNKTINNIEKEINKLNNLKLFISQSLFHQHIFTHNDEIIFNSFCYLVDNNISYWFFITNDFEIYNISKQFKKDIETNNENIKYFNNIIINFENIILLQNMKL
jgi:hypothetical protein